MGQEPNRTRGTVMLNIILIAMGVVCLIAGLIFLPLPTPFGIPLFLVGTGLILSASATSRRIFKAWRTAHRRMSDRLMAFEPHLPRKMQEVLLETHPDPDDRTDTPARDREQRPRHETGKETHTA